MMFGFLSFTFRTSNECSETFKTAPFLQMWKVLMLYHLLYQSGKPLASYVRWRHKHQCRERLVSSATHHQPVDLSRRKNVHPGQICKHQFNLHGESCCHQRWQKKLLGHVNMQRVTLLSPISLSNADIKPLWMSKAAIEKFFSLCQSKLQNGFWKVTVENDLDALQFLLYINCSQIAF